MARAAAGMDLDRMEGVDIWEGVTSLTIAPLAEPEAAENPAPPVPAQADGELLGTPRKFSLAVPTRLPAGDPPPSVTKAGQPALAPAKPTPLKFPKILRTRRNTWLVGFPRSLNRLQGCHGPLAFIAGVKDRAVLAQRSRAAGKPFPLRGRRPVYC